MIWLYLLLTTHITTVFFSLYVHRHMAHQQFKIHPRLGSVMRFWLWLTDGTGVREWVAIHHNHHKYSDKPGDPHLLFVTGTVWNRIKAIASVAYKSIFYGYRNFASKEEIKLYTAHVPYTWTEKYQRWGILLLLAFNVGMFGVWGILVWIIQISWATFWLTIVVAIGAHHFGYHKTNFNDNSRNLWPIAIVAAGEELHHNHHIDPSNPNLRTRWFEFDLGYIYMKMFEFFGLLRFNK